MKTEKKTEKKTETRNGVPNSIGRVGFALLCMMLQIGWFVLLFVKLNEFSRVLNIINTCWALALVLHIYARQENAAFKMPWIMLLLVFPIMGLCIYFLFGTKWAVQQVGKQYQQISREVAEGIPRDEAAFVRLEEQNLSMANQSRYLRGCAGYEVYAGTDVTFYPEASDAMEAQLAAIEQARQFVFMEYHAVEEGESFGRLKELLARKAAQGVEVRLLYDDVGSVGFLDKRFVKRMEQIGVQCRVFNPVFPLFHMFMNNRDHRKITVVDGKVGFTGGYNLADEYFNLTHPYGYWKDTGLRLEGDAVVSLTAQFLEMWNSLRKTDERYDKYLQSPPADVSGGFVQPYADSPLDDEFVGENVYLNLIKSAERKLYVATPYLIISDEMNRELGLAAKRGVDVRVITPGIPDKKMIYKVTRSYYNGLVRQGVRVYEYTPGFLHEKQMLCDDCKAVVGTINLDYRSLYHHFENAVLLLDCPAIQDISADFDATLSQCRDVTEEYRYGKSAVIRGTRLLLRLFAPLL